VVLLLMPHPAGGGALHTVPSALQVVPAAHVPHCKVPPQPSDIDPHTLPAAAQVVGVQIGVHVPDEVHD
jgi:hypothetical protein